MKRKKLGVAALLFAAASLVFGIAGPDDSFIVSRRTGTGLTDFEIWDCRKDEPLRLSAPESVFDACADEWSSRQSTRTGWFVGAGVAAIIGALCLRPRRDKPQKVLIGGENPA